MSQYPARPKRFLAIIYAVFFICTLRGGFSAAEDTSSAQCFTGLFIEGVPASFDKLEAARSVLGVDPGVVMWYRDFTKPFPLEECRRLRDRGYIAHITWEPWFWDNKAEACVTLQAIAAGQWDTYISQWAQAAKEFGSPFMLRWGHEFNGDWYPWCINSAAGNTPSLYGACFRRIRSIFDAHGASNAVWVWSPNCFPLPNPQTYPGDDVVDVIGIDCYNFGNNPPYSSGWKKFPGIFEPIYKYCSRFFPSKTIIIAEMGCSTMGGSRVEWLKEMDQTLKRDFPRVKGFIWFNNDKEADWAITPKDNFHDFFGGPYYGARTDRIFQLMKSAPAAEPGGLLLTDQIEAGALRNKYRMELPVIDPQPGTLAQSLKALSPRIVLGADNTVLGDKHNNFGASISAAVCPGKNELYVLYEVTDPSPMMNAYSGRDIWNGDTVELCLRVNAMEASSDYTKTDFQIGFKAGGQPQIYVWNGSMPEEAVSYVVEPSASGYTVLATLKLGLINGGAIPDSLLMNFAVDDDDGNGQRARQLVWTKEESFYLFPNRWGAARIEEKKQKEI